MKKSPFKLSLLIVAPITLIIGVIFSLYVFYPKKYDSEASSCAAVNLLDESLIYAVIKAESGFDEKRVSKKGAVGLMQLMPSTAKYVAEKYFNEAPGDLYNPSVNIRYGTRYLKYLIEKFADITVTLAAYNAGEGKVSSWLKDARYSADGKTFIIIPYKETEEYVAKVLRAQKFYKILYNLHS